MNAVGKLAGFAAVLGTTAFAGSRIDVRAGKRTDGVTATVKCATEKARVEFDARAVEAAGYRAVLPSSGPAEADAPVATPANAAA